MSNYFNYFTEVEEHFTRRRGKSLLVSPLDWCLIELWKENDIPLHIVLRGIDRSFEAAQKRQKKTPSTLFYCHPAVMEAFEEYGRAILGAPDSCDETETVEVRLAAPSRQCVLAHLDHLATELRSHAGEAFQRIAAQVSALRTETLHNPTMDWEMVDRDLSEMGNKLCRVLLEGLEAAQAKELRAEVRRELRIYQKHLSKEMYKRLQEHYLSRKILTSFGLPEFSLLQDVSENPDRDAELQ